MLQELEVLQVLLVRKDKKEKLDLLVIKDQLVLVRKVKKVRLEIQVLLGRKGRKVR